MKKVVLLILILIYSNLGIAQNGKLLSKSTIDSIFKVKGKVMLGVGTYCLPVDFTLNYNYDDIIIEGVPGKTIITSYDSTPGTNFAITLKVDGSIKQKEGVFQNEVTNEYFRVTNGVQKIIPLDTVKALGYLTELNTLLPDPGIDGLYVVVKHSPISYGGGMAHVNLKGNYNTDNKNVFYTQGTILKRENGIWSRHYTGAGFMTKGNMFIKNIIFDNCQFYLFSPFDSLAKIYTTTSDFEVDHCTFRNCSKIVSSMCYGGIDLQPNWYNNLQVYSAGGQLRFKNFKFTNNEATQIHSWIVCGFPPSYLTTITGNTIHDCFTWFCGFNLFIKYYGSEYYFTDRINQNISNNYFTNIRLIDNNAQTTLIRTSGMATVNNNQFIDVTQQVCFLSGGNATFSNNIVTKFVDGIETLSPVILIKMSVGTNIISGNSITAPFSTIVALEGTSNTIISGNNIIGLTRFRLVNSSLLSMTKDRVYYVVDTAVFHNLVGMGTYDTSIRTNTHVYYNKLKRQWVKTYLNLIGFVFSKADEAVGYQFLKISDNTIEAEGVTQIGGNPPGNFKSVNVSNNDISNAIYLHIGKTNIDDYIFSDNYTKGAFPLPVAPYTAIKNLFFEYNKVSK